MHNIDFRLEYQLSKVLLLDANWYLSLVGRLDLDISTMEHAF